LSVCPVHPRDALQEAVRCAAHGVIFVHSHPSGFMWTSSLRGDPPGNARRRVIQAGVGAHNEVRS
jgi:hypothetical protein